MKSLEQIFDKYSSTDGGGDKGSLHSYIEVYVREMTRRTKINLLEIGVWEGHSLAMWEEYFSGSKIIGIDIDPSRSLFPVDVRECNATSEEALKATLGKTRFDYIIDDGSHIPAHQVESFRLLWDRVKPGGKYFIEDIESDEALETITKVVEETGAEFIVYDLRGKKNRYDDILLVIRK